MSLPHIFFAGTKTKNAPASYYGAEYGGWTGDFIDASTSNNDSPYVGSATDVPQTLDQAMDWSTSTLYGGYDTVSKYASHAATNGGVYNGSANFYTYTGGRSNLSGHSVMGSDGRGACIAYLSDASRTPVLVVGHTSNLSSEGMYIFNLSSGGYMGKLTIATSKSGFAPSDLAGLAWDGTHVVAISRSPYLGGGLAHRILLPAGPNIGTPSSAANVVQEATLPHAVNYAAAWGGNVSADVGYLYLSDPANSSNSSSQVQINWATSTSQLIGARGKYSISVGDYSMFVDTKNRRLVLGGYSNFQRKSYGE